VTEEERRRAIRVRLCRDAAPPALPPIPTGNPAIDEALGGGFPRGAIVEIYGPESSGKSTLALRTIAWLQRNGGAAALIDADHALDPARAAALGVELEKLVTIRPEWSEQAMEIAHRLILSRALDLVVIDSAAALAPKAELESSLETAGAGWHTAALARGLRRLRADVVRAGVCVVFLNQLRSGAAGEPETSSGGRALKTYAALRVELRRKSGGMVRLMTVRNKYGPIQREAEFSAR
jgi:recombination protein RecA